MDVELQFVAALVAFLVLLSFLVRSKWSFWGGNTGRVAGKVLPEAAGKWPVIGHLHLLSGSKLPHLVLGELADQYGPIFSLRLGVNTAVVINNRELAQECFTTKDMSFCDRPKTLAIEIMGYDRGMFGFSPYGQYWREIRKIATVELLSNHRLTMFNNVWESEVKQAIRNMQRQCVQNSHDISKAEMKKWFGDIIMNVTCTIIAGRQFTPAENELNIKSFRKFMELMGAFPVSDALPYLKWLDLGGYIKIMKKTAKDIDSILQGWLDEHKHRRVATSVNHDRSFMDVMLRLVDDVETGIDVDIVNKSTCLSLALGATDTTAVTLTWTLALLLNNRKVLKKAQEEIDNCVGRSRQVKESDLKNLVYLEAVIKESMRLYPAAQLSPPREAVEDCTVGGYHIPAGTRLFVNLWKLQRDDNVWSDPNMFLPERFLCGGGNEDVDLRGQHFELLPFGSGRRICPGISFAFKVIQCTLANLLHAFEFSTPFDEVVDMTEDYGLTNIKATPFDVLLSPRLSAQVYG